MSHFRAIIVFILLLLSSSQYSYAEKKVPSKASTQMEQAHEFISYLVKLGVIEIDVKKTCYNSESEPKTTTYTKESCASTFITSYKCEQDKNPHITKTKIDWYYVSEMAQSGYGDESKGINILGRVTAAYSDGKSTKPGKAESTKQTKITFDSATTKNRALKAFTLLKEQCDTSKNFPF